MAMALSRQELEALLGSGAGQPYASVDEKALDRFSQKAVECLEALLGSFCRFEPGKPSLSTWDKLPLAMDVSVGTRLVLVETQSSSPALSVLVATTSLTAYHLDETANRANGSTNAHAPFAAWRRVIEYVITESVAALAMSDGARRAVWRSQSPRRWDIGACGGAEPAIDSEAQIVVIPFYSTDEKTRAVYVLMSPEALAQLCPSTTAAATGVEEACSPVVSSLVAEIPLSISVMVPAVQLTVRSVALWEIDSLIPLVLAPNQPVRLHANDYPLAIGDLVVQDDGSLAVKITALLPQ